jgi:peptidoglycan/LPS O-acetylase OafA/YrhL
MDHGTIAIAVLACMFLIYLNETKHISPNFIRRNDFSYSVYLFHWPILQFCYNVLLFKFGEVSYMTIFVLTSPIVIIISLSSWFFVEKKVHNLKIKL